VLRGLGFVRFVRWVLQICTSVWGMDFRFVRRGGRWG
jgi:hypothetical protein